MDFRRFTVSERTEHDSSVGCMNFPVMLIHPGPPTT